MNFLSDWSFDLFDQSILTCYIELRFDVLK
jgi:hypothetical protein